MLYWKGSSHHRLLLLSTFAAVLVGVLGPIHLAPQLRRFKSCEQVERTEIANELHDYSSSGLWPARCKDHNSRGMRAIQCGIDGMGKRRFLPCDPVKFAKGSVRRVFFPDRVMARSVQSLVRRRDDSTTGDFRRLFGNEDWCSVFHHKRTALVAANGVNVYSGSFNN